jgi:hypothetical protein
LLRRVRPIDSSPVDGPPSSAHSGRNSGPAAAFGRACAGGVALGGFLGGPPGDPGRRSLRAARPVARVDSAILSAAASNRSKKESSRGKNSPLERLHQSPAVSTFACCQEQTSSPRRFWTGHVIELDFSSWGYVQDGASGFHRRSLAPYKPCNLPPKAGPSPCGPFQGGPPTGGMPAYHDRMSPRWHLRALVQGLLLPDPDKRLVPLRHLFRW